MAIAKAVLAVFAHPDDCVLTCYGTLMRMRDLGYHVIVLELTHGENSHGSDVGSRPAEARAAADLAGYALFQERFPDGNVGFDSFTVSTIEAYIERTCPSVVLTHFPQKDGRGHQDHWGVASSTVNVAERRGCVETVLYAEPPTQIHGFLPDYFVDITEYMEAKKRALLVHQSELRKPYMQAEAIEIRGRWWALQGDLAHFGEGKYYEAFRTVKHVSRVGRATFLV